MLKELQKTITVVESKQDWAQMNRQSPVINPPKTRAAYIVSFAIDGDADNLRDAVVVRDTKANKFYSVVSGQWSVVSGQKKPFD